jgi:DNA-binding winged helix-turn-helix (wHTH) protein/pimeloyl-ACP methyl ester carboxylesterase
VSRCYEFGQFRLDPDDRMLFRGDELVPLPPKVAETLTVLVENAGKVVSKEELVRRIWPNTFIEEGSLTRTISILRKALDVGNGQELIATLSKRGYRFSGALKETGVTRSHSTGVLPANELVGTITATADTVHALVEFDFKLTDRVCRRLNRATLDPLIIGDHLRYVDNQVRSDVLVLFLHGLGLDHRDFEPILMRLPYRGISPTLYGCEPERRGRISLSLADHVVILREFLRDLVLHLEPKIIIMVGFSMGADMGFDLLLGPTDEPGPEIDGFLSLECNLCLDTCTISQVLADIAPEHPEISVADLRRLGASAASLEQWLNIHAYLVRVLRKFQGDTGVLQRAASDLVRPFRDAQGSEVLAAWFRGARKRVRVLRLVFPNDSRTVGALARLRLENLDGEILGGEFPETTIRVSAKTDHFELMSAEDVLRQVDELVAETRSFRARNSRQISA